MLALVAPPDMLFRARWRNEDLGLLFLPILFAVLGHTDIFTVGGANVERFRV